MAIAGDWLAATLQPRRLPRCSTTTSTPWRRRLHDGGHRVGGRVARRSPAARPTCAGSTTPTGSRSRATPTSRSPKTSPTRFIAYGWNVTTRRRRQRPRPMVASALRTRSRPSNERPTLILVAQPHRLRLAASGQPEGPRRAARRGGRQGTPSASSACPRTQDFYVPDGVYDAFAARASAARPAKATHGVGGDARGLQRRLSRAGRRDRPDAAPRAARRLGRATCPMFPPTRRDRRRRDSSGQVLNALARHVPWLVGGSADLAPSTKTRLTFEGAGDFQPRRPAGPQPPLRHPRARARPRSPTAWR